MSNERVGINSKGKAMPLPMLEAKEIAWEKAGNWANKQIKDWEFQAAMEDIGMLGEDYQGLARGDYIGLGLMAVHELVAAQPLHTIPVQVISLLGRMLSESNESANKSRDSFSVANNKLEDLRGRFSKLESKLEAFSDDIVKMRRENLMLVKQHNIFCNTARRVFSYITSIYHSCSISEDQHKRLLHFTTMPRC